METLIGLLVVHGIGNQKEGVLADEVASSLDDSSTALLKNNDSLNLGQRVDPQNKKTQECPEPKKIEVNGTPVLVHEADWASISNPNNEPKIVYNKDILPEYLRTIRTAWYIVWRSFTGNKTLESNSEGNSMAIWLILTIVLDAIILSFILSPELMSPLISFWNEIVQENSMLILGIPLIILIIYSMYNTIHKWDMKRLDGMRADWKSYIIYLPLAVVHGYSRPFYFFIFFPFGAQLLLFFSLLVFIVYPLNYLGWILIYPFQKVGKFCERFQHKLTYLWIYRLGWIVVVMPVLAIVESVRAVGNLFSIMFLERGIATRIFAFLGLFEVYILFIVILVVCELLILLVLFPFIGSLSTLIFTFPLLLLSLVFIRFALPAIDLILDIANYHVAAFADRKEYYEQIDKGLRTLRDSGCTEIHVLAHSLGSVIVYDWLHARRSESYPISVLHTIGSPLNKFWYVDHTQERRLEDKQGLENLVSSSWINYWAYSDPVSGKLNHYNAPNLNVTNKRIHWLGGYVLSHARYWRNKVVLDSIREWMIKNYAQLQKSM